MSPKHIVCISYYIKQFSSWSKSFRSADLAFWLLVARCLTGRVCPNGYPKNFTMYKSTDFDLFLILGSGRKPRNNLWKSSNPYNYSSILYVFKTIFFREIRDERCLEALSSLKRNTQRAKIKAISISQLVVILCLSVGILCHFWCIVPISATRVALVL